MHFSTTEPIKRCRSFDNVDEADGTEFGPAILHVQRDGSETEAVFIDTFTSSRSNELIHSLSVRKSSRK